MNVDNTKEWTLMFYMASDNPLAISAMSQLKALKAAGFHDEANVIAQFDPYTEGTPTHIFDVNLINKLAQKDKKPKIGFTDDADLLTVRNLIEDKLWTGKEQGESGFIREALGKVLKAKHHDLFEYNPPQPPDLNGNSGAPITEAAAFNVMSQPVVSNGQPKRPPRRIRRRYEPDPYVSLYKFLDFCSKKYPARHYMLFILGHGVVVGNDIFLYDEHAEEHSITLTEMGVLLKDFKTKIPQGSTFDLVGFHSCSVSSMEVAYELQGTADYMLASQGPSFVGSWPYRQILMRVFKDIAPNGTSKNIPKVIDDIFTYCLENSKDFLLAGYSYQLTLCDLRRISQLKASMQEMTNALAKGMGDAGSMFIVLYSHWKAQSFFQEMYTDLYDFCFCVVDRFKRIEKARPGTSSDELVEISAACEKVMGSLSSVVVKTEYTGPAYQYSHGLSVYFPWSEPSVDSQIMEQYAFYVFHKEFHSEELGNRSWKDFLEKYFKGTQRVTSRTELFWELEENGDFVQATLATNPNLEQKVNEDIVSLIYNGEGPLGGSLSKSDPKDRTGGDCECPSFKNYPRDTRAKRERRNNARPMPLPGSIIGGFKPTLS